MSAPLSPPRCVCQATSATDSTAAEHEKWCPSRKPTPERLAELKAGTGRPLMDGELEWLRGDANRSELHVTGARGGHWSLTDDLPGAVLELARELGAMVAEVDRLHPALNQSENDLTGARLSLWEEEQDTRRLRVALESAKRGRRELRARLERRTVLLRDVQRIARGRTAEARGRKAYGERLKARIAELETGLALPWAATMSDDDLHGFLGDLVAAAMDRWRSDPEVPDRVTLANVERACAGWRAPGRGFRSDDPEAAPAAELTVFRASYNSIVIGLYTTAAAARKHCETLLRREMPFTVFGIAEGEKHLSAQGQATADSSLDWIEDEEDGVAELVAAVDGDEAETGYVVTALTVAEAYDPDGDE